jgi:SNF2 family DNA or RNA helicase
VKFDPRLYQSTMIDWICDIPRCGIWAGMGLGKTASTLTALRHLDLVQPGPTLVLAPLRVAQSTWPDEVTKWDHLAGLTVSPVVGDVAQRRAALRKKADIYTMNYDNLPWLIETLGRDRFPFSTVVADEATRLKGFRLRQGGKRARALGQVAHTKVSRFIQLTGTPAPNGIEGLWGQAWFLDRGQRLGLTFKAFTDRWFQTIAVDGGYQQIKPFKHAQPEIEAHLRDLCISFNAGDWLDVREPVVNTIRVELPPKARRAYQEMEREMYLSIDGHEVEAFAAAAKTMKCLQLANGAIYTDDKGAWVEVHDAKLQALDSIVTEANGMPVLVAYHFKSDAARIQRAFPQARVLDADPQTIRDWNAGKIPMLLAHPASAGHGLNLQNGGNIIAVFGHWWDLEQYQQILERIGPARQLQAGHDRPVFIHHIVAADTVDELVMARRETKRSVQDLLMGAMKR